MDAQLEAKVRRYYAHRGEVVDVAIGHNLLGQPTFRTLTFADGSQATFCKAADDISWYRNERHAKEV